MVGSAIVRRLEREHCEVVTAPRSALDLTRQDQTEYFLRETRPDAIFVAAATVGGILANDTYPAMFLRENIAIVENVVHGAHLAGVKKLLFLGSSCVYPKFAPQPIQERALLTGPLEATNEWYAIAKIVGIKLCQAYRKQYGDDFNSAMPSNLYGPGDNYDVNSSHVLPALLRKAHEAKLTDQPEIVMWGTGTPRRELLHSDDCADALIFLMKNYSDFEHVNVGTGCDISILELTELICKMVGYGGAIARDLSKPDGTPRKLMDVSRLTTLGWTATIPLEQGIADAYTSFLKEYNGPNARMASHGQA